MSDEEAARRGHFRSPHRKRLLSPYYKKKRGKTINIRGTWVGPKEGTIGNKHYRVITDFDKLDDPINVQQLVAV